MFAAMTVSMMLIIGLGAFGAALSSTANPQLQTDIGELLGNTLGFLSVVPLILLVGLMVGVLGVLAR
jgi:hypothetical protein